MKGMLDVFLGMMAVVLLTNGDLLAFTCGIVATIPDMFHPVDVAFARRHGMPFPQFHENPYAQMPKTLPRRLLSAQRRFHYRMHLMERDEVPRWLGLLTQGSAMVAGVTVLLTFAV
jgi:hypothetical protein